MYDLISFEDNARVWIYGADRKLVDNEVALAHYKINEFAKRWVSHNKALKATGGLMHAVFVVLLVDQNYNAPGGCSIDESVRFLHELEQEFGMCLFDRKLFYYLEGDQVCIIPMDELKSSYREGKINSDTLFFDTLVQDKMNYQKHWLKPLGSAWQKRFLD